MVEGRDIHNLQMGVVVNRAMVTPKRSKKVPVVLTNTNSYNIWIRQPLLAADIVEVESCPWDYQTILSHDDKEIKASFCRVPPPEVQEEVFTSNVMSMEIILMRFVEMELQVRNQRNLDLVLILAVRILIL